MRYSQKKKKNQFLVKENEIRKAWLVCLKHRFSWNFTYMSYGKKQRLDLSAYWENQHICIKAERESLFVMNLTNCGLEGEKLFLKLLPTWEQKWKWEGHRVVRRLQTVLNSLLRRKCEKDRNLLLGVMLPALGSWTFLALLKSISALISYGCKREEDFFFFGLRVHICSFEILLHFHSSCWWVRQIYITMLLWVVETVSPWK